MIRRDEIIERLGKLNSTNIVTQQVDDLEKFVDSALMSDENIKKWINSSSIGSVITSGIERVLSPNITNDVHRDITTNGDSKITIGTDVNAVAYTKWSDDITTKDNTDATNEPWNDRTIAEGQFDGVLTIECPRGTNKNAALELANKYMSIDIFDSDGNPVGGFWAKAVKPNDKNNDITTGLKLEDAVTVTYNILTDIVYMNFKLF